MTPLPRLTVAALTLTLTSTLAAPFPHPTNHQGPIIQKRGVPEFTADRFGEWTKTLFLETMPGPKDDLENAFEVERKLREDGGEMVRREVGEKEASVEETGSGDASICPFWMFGIDCNGKKKEK